jgi:predicted nucleic acid-binding protein
VSAPDLLNAETLNVLRRYERAGFIDESRSRAALDDLVQLPIARYPTLALLDSAWSVRRNLSAYDAMYASLAAALDEPLVTTDARLASAARRHTGASIVLLGA